MKQRKLKNLRTGARFIHPTESHSTPMIATANTIKSEKCKERLCVSESGFVSLINAETMVQTLSKSDAETIVAFSRAAMVKTVSKLSSKA